VPHLPFPGRIWSTKTSWEYTRHTTAGSTSAAVDEERKNEHALVGKRVFTDRVVYRGGDRVTICAELWTRAGAEPVAHFVVAHCFPIAEPDRITRRILALGDACARVDGVLEKQRKPICIRGFKPQIEDVAQMSFPVVEAPFRIWSTVDSTVLHESSLRIPVQAPLNVACPSSTHVELQVFHTAKRVRATAISASGEAIDMAESTDEQGVVQTLVLEGPEIVRIVVEGGRGEGYLSGICVDKRMIRVDRWKAVSRYYSGKFDLPLREPAGPWAVAVIAQTLDATPTGGDPITAARRLGGIVDSANVVEQGECVCALLYDHTFDVV
jgi:hypothetical protein